MSGGKIEHVTPPSDETVSGAAFEESDPFDASALSFEEARDQLVRVVAELEQGAPTLEHSLTLWERGEALAARCEEWLIGAKRRLDSARRPEGSDS